MELTKEQIESFIEAYKESFGEVLRYEDAFEIAHRLVWAFKILEKAEAEADRNNKRAVK